MPLCHRVHPLVISLYFDRWCGDPGKIIILERILEVIKREKLLDNVNKTGAVLKQGLLDAQKEFPSILNSTRGRGTFLAINAKDGKTRDAIVGNLKKKGVQSGGCGDVSLSISLRIQLIYFFNFSYQFDSDQHSFLNQSMQIFS